MGNKSSDEATGPTCSIERTVDIIGERWTFLILREALLDGVTKFGEFSTRLGIGPNTLLDRLNKLVGAGLMTKESYKEVGERPRPSYHPTDAGKQLTLVLAALQQWGDDNNPPESGVSMIRRTEASNRPVRLTFVDDENETHPLSDIAFIPTTPRTSDSSKEASRAGA